MKENRPAVLGDGTVITRRTLLIFNFGIAALFALIGGLSVYALSVVQPGNAQIAVPPAFTVSAFRSVAQEKEIEKLRSQAIFYYELARDMRKARHEATEGYFYDVRLLSFFVAGLFAIGGLLVLAPPNAGEQST